MHQYSHQRPVLITVAEDLYAAQQALGATPDPARLPRTRGNPTKVVRRARPAGNRLRETWEVTAC